MGGRRHIFTGSKYEELAGYARAVVVDDRIFVSGTVGYDFKTGELPETAEGQTEQALNTIAWSLEASGAPGSATSSASASMCRTRMTSSRCPRH